MNGFLGQFGISLRLHFRNTMALFYSFLFPVIFLVAFWVLYRHDTVPLARHLGELLTVTALGGACFGLPTAMVAERERGVWRRYRLAPVPSASLVAGTVAARYVTVVLAGVLQLLLAVAIGMPLPRHPFDLWLAFTLVAFAFLGLGLVIAMMADNVPAVQALGQCIFLPMLIIGGVAVPLASLPDWAQHLSAFFPGRYAVEALQATVTGAGLGSARFNVLALLLIGAAGTVAGAKLFRWDAQQRFAARTGKAWAVVALAAWVAVGVLAETRGRATVTTPSDARTPTLVRTQPPPAPAGEPGSSDAAAPPAVKPAPDPVPPSLTRTSPAEPRDTAEPGPQRARTETPPPTRKPPSAAPQPLAPPDPAPETEEKRRTEPPPVRTFAGPQSWQEVTRADVDRNLIFTHLPPDSGIVTPIAAPDEQPDPDLAAEIELVRGTLPYWGPGQVDDPVQRVRNYLYIPAVADVFQMPHERFLPRVVFDRLQEIQPREQLIQILYWIALHPNEGDDSAVDQLRDAGLDVQGPSDIVQARERVALYGVKLLGRLMGKIPAETGRQR
jgi:ABC-type transport system involved in cytochrome c biogenesis permease component